MDSPYFTTSSFHLMVFHYPRFLLVCTRCNGPSSKRLMATAEPDSISSLLSRQTVFFQFPKLMQEKCVIEINVHPVFSQRVIILP